MINIGIIGAGAISENHLLAYKANPYSHVTAIADLNLSLARKRADEFNIENVFTDYHDLLSDKSIDAVSIVTPTFTHKDIVIDALKAGKDVLCEKPPALTGDDVEKCVKISQETGKILMYAFVCRFRSHVQHLKNYIDSGKMGEFVYAEAARILRSIEYNGWFCDKTKSGGFLFDGAIHELDMMLYLMGYPKPKTVLAFSSNINNDLPQKIKGISSKYMSLDTNNYDRTIESFLTAHITLDNGSCINIKSSSVLNSVPHGIKLDICGKNAGAHMEPENPGKELELLELSNDGYFHKNIPIISSNNPFNEEINHFIDCCKNKTDCICKSEEAITLIRLINAIYESAETGKAIELL